MIWKRLFLLLLIVFVGKSIEADMRSTKMSVMNGRQFQCANTTCPPFITLAVSNVRRCQMACLANNRCQGASFQSTSNCQLFDNVENQNGNMMAQIDIVTMIVMSGTRISSELTTTTTTPIPAVTTTPMSTTTRTTTTTTVSQNPCATGFYWNVTGSTVAGTGTSGVGLNQLNTPYGIYLDSSDSLYIADMNNYRVMKYLPGASDGIVIAGVTGSPGTALNKLQRPTYLYVDSSQNLYVTDTNNYRVLRWANGASTGSIIAGNGSNGSALNELHDPYGLWVDSSSNLFIVEWYNMRVTKWAFNASSGTVVAGTPGSAGNTPDKFNGPLGLVYDEINEDLYIANYAACTISKWHVGNSTGTIIGGVPGTSGLTATQLSNPCGITLDRWKNVYVADYTNSRVQLFCEGNTTGITIAGNGTGGSSLSAPSDVKFDSQMNLYVSEMDGHRVKKFNKL